jgi:hypothetical protein
VSIIDDDGASGPHKVECRHRALVAVDAIDQDEVRRVIPDRSRSGYIRIMVRTKPNVHWETSDLRNNALKPLFGMFHANDPRGSLPKPRSASPRAEFKDKIARKNP